MPEERSNTIAFTFPGQGSYRPELLGELFHAGGGGDRILRMADDVCRRFFDVEFLPLVAAQSPEEHDRHLARFPDLDQVGIYLADVLAARSAMEHGFRPEALIGHSFGELAALTVAGVFDVEAGVRLVCQRIETLGNAGVEGRMGALSTDRERVTSLLERLPAGAGELQISVVNHSGQTVVSGPVPSLETLKELAAGEGVMLTVLKSRYPFHSTHLAQAVPGFETCLKAYSFQRAAIPVYLGTEGRWLEDGDDVAAILARQFVTRLNFEGAVRELFDKGFRVFLECGGADIVSKVVSRVMSGNEEVLARPLASNTGGFQEGLEELAATALSSESGGPASGVSELAGSLDRISREVASAREQLREIAVDFSGAGASPQTARSSSHPPAEAAGIEDFPEDPCNDLPVAIVSMGCVLPGAVDPENYWQNLRAGISGIVDLAEEDPHARHDFMGGTAEKIEPDKTYTLLNGSILKIAYEPAALEGFVTEEEFGRYTRGQKILALALGQTIAGLGGTDSDFGELTIECILGATGDGSEEYDEALFTDRLYARLSEMDGPEEARQAFAGALRSATGFEAGDSDRLEQKRMYDEIVGRFFQGKVSAYVVDTACSSSLYSIDLGIKSLRDREADLILAGGVFAPGPANNTLFAQFRGLTPSGSRPLDAAADGVVFADGAGIVALKRLDDALESGDEILAVIRGTGLSSDGKSPSVNVPQPGGQKIAVHRAYESSGVNPGTIQYVEAHATSTPVGDAAEFKGLADSFSIGRSDGQPIEIGSVKALVGHTGWASGVASVIKFCKAFEHRTVPRQYHFETPNPNIDLAASPFTISKEEHPWPENAEGLPRRAGINGFGFGGTNAHLILEEYIPGYHRKLAGRYEDAGRPSSALAVVGIGSLFPDDDEVGIQNGGSHRQFTRGSFRLPSGKMLLPDVTDHMDSTQYLAALAAEKVLEGVSGSWEEMRTEIGVVLGITSKTERGAQADERIFLDRLQRRIALEDAGAEVLEVLERISDGIRENFVASGPYTLPGLMPNVAAGRVTSLFDLKGPNIVIDRGSSSLWQALRTADKLLRNGDCRMVMAGGINAFGGAGNGDREGAVLLGLMTKEEADKAGLPILARLDVSEIGHESQDAKAAEKEIPVEASVFRGCHLGREIADVFEGFRHQEKTPVRIVDGAEPSPDHRGILTLFPGSENGNGRYPVVELAATESKPETPPVGAPVPNTKGASDPEEKAGGAYAFVQDTPIYNATPVLTPIEAENHTVALEGKRVLFLTNQPDFWSALKDSNVLEPFEAVVAAPAGSGVDGVLEVDLSTDETIEAAWESLGAPPDAIIAVKNLSGVPVEILLEEGVAGESDFADLLFAVSRKFYDRISAGQTSLATLCLDGWTEGGVMHPTSGLLAGFVKSLARELPGSVCRCLTTDESNFLQGIQRVENELGQEKFPGEITYRDGTRHGFRLVELEELARDDQPCLNSKSVVIATGGGRGVTAVLAESLLDRFGCTVVAVGRSRLDGVPEEVLEKTEDEFKAWESQFYRDEIARDRSQNIKDLRKLYGRYQAANELNRVIQGLQKLPGHFEYLPLDINDAEAVGEFVKRVIGEYGSVDLIVHGAGIQDSQVMTKKSIDLFRRIVSTKIRSLSSFYRACERHAPGHPVNYHILTSAFSYMGNDGQPDYGAANEAMNRTAEAMSVRQPDRHWSSMAWLGWAGIGMTRGSEFAALAANRRLRGVTREEGQAIFSELMSGRPAASINVLMADGEMKFYDMPVEKKKHEATGPKKIADLPMSRFESFEFNAENAPFLRDHRVHGIPTLPGAFIIGMVAEFALRMRPELKITAFRDTRFLKFVSVFESRGLNVNLKADVVSETTEETRIRVQLLSDFVHKSGRVLQKDILHTEIFVCMSAELPEPPERSYPLNGSDSVDLPDPYVMDRSPVRLNGQFNSMSRLSVGKEFRTADYRLLDERYPPSPYSHLLPNVIMVDAFWRFGTVEMKPNRTLSVFVPRECEVMRVFFDYSDFASPVLTDSVEFRGNNPTPDGDLLHVGPIETRDRDGRVMLVVEGGVCQRFGDITDAF